MDLPSIRSPEKDPGALMAEEEDEERLSHEIVASPFDFFDYKGDFIPHVPVEELDDFARFKANAFSIPNNAECQTYGLAKTIELRRTGVRSMIEENPTSVMDDLQIIVRLPQGNSSISVPLFKLLTQCSTTVSLLKQTAGHIIDITFQHSTQSPPFSWRPLVRPPNRDLALWIKLDCDSVINSFWICLVTI
jgi:hypothetical protein